jgi:hypothetical protein
MVVERRETAKSAMKRALLLDATAQIMLEESYVAGKAMALFSREPSPTPSP